VYTYADLTYFDKQMPFAANACGGNDPKLACEASGSKLARVFNEVQFYVARADAHRKAGQAPACKQVLQAAYALASGWRKEYDEDRRSPSWKTGLKYRSRGGEVLNEEQIAGRIDGMGKEADEKALGGFCASAR